MKRPKRHGPEPRRGAPAQAPALPGEVPGARRRPDPRHVPVSGPAFTRELEALERRLEAAVPDFAGLETAEPCVWFCACFLAHGP